MNILFDLDGTLTDPFEGITKCISHALCMLGKTSPPVENMKWCIGPPLKKSFSLLLASDDEQLAEKALTIYRERFGLVGLFENEIYQDIPEVLKTLKGMGHTLYVATSKPTVYAQRIIEHFGLLRYFRRVYGSELDGTRCDKSSLISYILQKEMIPSSETFMVGDREHDIIGAKANGVYSIGVLWGYGTQKELDNSNACVRKPQALISLMKKMIPPKKTRD
jgi:phosphoglycolate phosphatase